MENDKFKDLENTATFESRKREHLEVALSSKVDAREASDFDRVVLTHEALPDLNFSEITIAVQTLGKAQRTPFLISSMTAGHTGSIDLNSRLAKAAALKGWLMGVGSQRRELTDETLRGEWRAIRRIAPNAQLLGNIGIAQLIRTSVDQIEALVESLEAQAMIVHLNPLQEVLQVEGTTDFKGGLLAIADLCRQLSVPVVVKETGCGISASTAKRLMEAGVRAIDVGGLGGTHWGRVEGERAAKQTSAAAKIRSEAAQTFSSWGISTVEAVQDVYLELSSLRSKPEVWGSGGVRSGLDAFKLLAMGANLVGFAKPILQAALESEESLVKYMDLVEYELRVAMFCTGQGTLTDLASKEIWQWQTT